MLREWVTSPCKGFSLSLSPMHWIVTQVLGHLPCSCRYSALHVWAGDALGRQNRHLVWSAKPVYYLRIQQKAINLPHFSVQSAKTFLLEIATVLLAVCGSCFCSPQMSGIAQCRGCLGMHSVGGQWARFPPQQSFAWALQNGREKRKETRSSFWNCIIPKLREEAKFKWKGRFLVKGGELANLAVSSSHAAVYGGMAGFSASFNCLFPVTNLY